MGKRERQPSSTWTADGKNEEGPDRSQPVCTQSQGGDELDNGLSSALQGRDHDRAI